MLSSFLSYIAAALVGLVTVGIIIFELKKEIARLQAENAILTAKHEKWKRAVDWEFWTDINELHNHLYPNDPWDDGDNYDNWMCM